MDRSTFFIISSLFSFSLSLLVFFYYFITMSFVILIYFCIGCQCECLSFLSFSLSFVLLFSFSSVHKPMHNNVHKLQICVVNSIDRSISSLLANDTCNHLEVSLSLSLSLRFMRLLALFSAISVSVYRRRRTLNQIKCKVCLLV